MPTPPPSRLPRSLTPAPSSCASPSTTTRAARGRAGDPAQARRPGRGRADHRRLPLQRPSAAGRVPGHGARRSPSTASTRATSGAKRHDENFRDHRSRRDRQRQAGAHRRQLGLARPGAADRADGCQRQAARAGRFARRDDRGDGPVGACARRSWPRRRASRTTGSSSAPRSRGVRDLVDVYTLLAARCDYPLHLGPD